ncbi:hypothetical protein WCD74_05975 [Actinomycetospora sp. OC33-EN08]|uniref:Uncharacterized protein n=1 Tax=Actinomycetospora aurantiaca TaxID=3129233 RepID=A0ABU8MJ06_9PSEU
MPDATSRTTATDPSPEEKPSATGLTIPQIVGGALAAATAAILGSFLGVVGTIGGAAVASVISTVGTALYQRSLERTRDAVKSRLVVNQAAGPKVANAVARVTGEVGSPQARPGPGAPRPGMPGAPVPGAPGRPGVPPQQGGAPMSPPFGAPVAPGAPTRRLPDGTVVPAQPQQLRAGGRTVATRLDASGRPVPEPADPTRRIPNSRTPDGGLPTQAVPPLGPDGRPAARPTQRMGMTGPFSPPGGQPTTHLMHGPGDDPTQLAPAADQPKRRRFGWKTWATLGGVAASIFAIGLLASFAVESATGHPLSGGSSGTSVGSLFGQDTAAPATTESTGDQDTQDTDAPATTSSEEGTGNEEGTQAPSSTTRAPSTTTSRAPQQQNPLQSLLPRPGDGGGTGN